MSLDKLENFDAGNLNLDGIESKALSQASLDVLIESIKEDMGAAKTVEQVLAVLSRASMLAIKLGILG